MTRNRIKLRPGAASRARWLLYCTAMMFAAATRADVIAPDWSLETSAGLAVEYHADTRGAPTVLLFWASWCPHCRAVLPTIEALHSEFARQGAHFFALNIWEDGDPLAYFAERGYTLPLILAADLIAEDYGVESTPAIIVTDGAHVVQVLDYGDGSPAATARAIRNYLLTELPAASPADR
jgi:thiol-disulfide isomerase/thioredoxin